MKRYIKSSLNIDLHNISRSSINGGNTKELMSELRELLADIPINRYVLVVGNRGYCTGYYKSGSDEFTWLYNDEIKEISKYWDTNDNYIVLPATFQPGDRINYEDDKILVYEIADIDKEIYSGLEDYDPMKNDSWKFCKDLGIYYLIDYYKYKIYVKWSVS